MASFLGTFESRVATRLSNSRPLPGLVHIKVPGLIVRVPPEAKGTYWETSRRRLLMYKVHPVVWTKANSRELDREEYQTVFISSQGKQNVDSP